MFHPGVRMYKSQFSSVQSEPRSTGVIGKCFRPERAPVFDISAERLPAFSQLNADLIGAAGFEATFEFAEATQLSERPNVSDHGQAVPRLPVVHASPQPISPVTNLNGSQSLRGDFPWDDAEVTAMDTMSGKLPNQGSLSRFGTGEDHYAARFPINTMHHEYISDRRPHCPCPLFALG